MNPDRTPAMRQARMSFLAAGKLLRLAIAWCAVAVMAHGDEIILSDELDRPPLPIQTRIAINPKDVPRVEARVTLVFPHSGFEVTDWGVPAMSGNRFSVDLTITSEPIAMPVLTELNQTCHLGPLAHGDSTFEGMARDRGRHWVADPRIVRGILTRNVERSRLRPGARGSRPATGEPPSACIAAGNADTNRRTAIAERRRSWEASHALEGALLRGG